MNTLTNPRMRDEQGRARLRSAAIAAVGALALLGAFGSMSAFASHPEVSLAGSDFEIDTDANLVVDDGTPSIDWASVTELRRQDSPSGSGDESFGQGTKEDTALPKIVSGGIPPNKSDLKYFGVYQEGTTSDGFLNLYWARVQDPSGTTNMDFEINKNRCDLNETPTNCAPNGVTPIRSVGDLLVTYDLAGGGSNPTLSLREWTGSVWGAPDDLTTSGDATGSINTATITAGNSDGLGGFSPRTFGEAQLDLSTIFTDPNQCEAFGSVYLKSRSSDAFTAAAKDFVPPQAVDISNCVPSTLSSNQSWVPNDSVTVSAPSGGAMAGSVSFALYPTADCTGTAIYDTGATPIAVAGASPQTVNSANTTAVTATGSYSWKVSFDSTNPKQQDIGATCHETSSITITNGGSVSSQ